MPNNNTNNTEQTDDYYDSKNKKMKYETDVKNKINRKLKPNIEEYSSNLWEMPTPYIPYKKEEPIAIIPIQKNQNSLDAKNITKGNSENYFYKNNKQKLIKDNHNINYINNDNNNKNEIKKKSN